MAWILSSGAVLCKLRLQLSIANKMASSTCEEKTKKDANV
jgi:hypothetical protein